MVQQQGTATVSCNFRLLALSLRTARANCSFASRLQSSVGNPSIVTIVFMYLNGQCSAVSVDYRTGGLPAEIVEILLVESENDVSEVVNVAPARLAPHTPDNLS